MLVIGNSDLGDAHRYFVEYITRLTAIFVMMMIIIIIIMVTALIV